MNRQDIIESLPNVKRRSHRYACGMMCLRGFNLLTRTLFNYLHVQTRSFPLFTHQVCNLSSDLRTIEQNVSVDKFLTRHEQGSTQGTIFDNVAAPSSAVCHLLTTRVASDDCQQGNRTQHSGCTVQTSLHHVVTG